jgi:hypothetical protein
MVKNQIKNINIMQQNLIGKLKNFTRNGNGMESQFLLYDTTSGGVNVYVDKSIDGILEKYSQTHTAIHMLCRSHIIKNNYYDLKDVGEIYLKFNDIADKIHSMLKPEFDKTLQKLCHLSKEMKILYNLSSK